MKKWIFIFALTMTSVAVSAQSSYDIISGETYYLLGDDVNIRKSPDLKAEVITKLKIGTRVLVLEVLSSTLTIGNFESNWCKVMVLDNKSQKTTTTGYLWGGLLSLWTAEAEGQDGLFMVSGISKVEKQPYWDKPFIQVRIVKNNTQLAKIEFETVGSLSTACNMTVYGNRGISTIKNVIKFHFSEDFCGGANGDVYLFWDGKQLYHVETLQYGTDVPVFSRQYLYFPDDEEGIAGKVLFYSVAGEYVDEDVEGSEDGIIYEYKIQVTYEWNGKELKEVE